MKPKGSDTECRQCRELVSRAQAILKRERALSEEEASRYMYELAQARKLLIAEVASHIAAGEWLWVELREDAIAGIAADWAGCL